MVIADSTKLYELSESHPAILKLKEGKVSDITIDELTHPRITHFYTQEYLLFVSLGEKYEDCIKKLHRISNTVDLEVYMQNLEREYRRDLIRHDYEQGDALQMAHNVSKAVRKVWYRMRTNFDIIGELHQQRVAYIQALGDYLYDNRHVRRKIDLMLIIKDLARGTDGWESDMDLAFSFNVKDNATARAVAINAVEPVIRKFEFDRHEARPSETAHIDWIDQTYATSWLRFISRQPSLLEQTFDGLKTNTRTRKFVSENIFGFQDGTLLSFPIEPISKREIYGELIEKFTQLPTDSGKDIHSMPDTKLTGKTIYHFVARPPSQPEEIVHVRV